MRVERTFAFLDLCGFTSFTAVEGDERATAVLAGFRACIREIGSRRGVRIAKWLGDGAMLVGVEPRPLIEAVLETEQRIDGGGSALLLRAGMARGLVILFEGDDYIGTPVNLAARLCDLAVPRQVLATPALVDCCPRWAVASEPRAVAVPGFLDPVEIVGIVRAPGGPDAVTDPICGMAFNASLTDWTRGDTAFCSESCAAAWADRTRSSS